MTSADDLVNFAQPVIDQYGPMPDLELLLRGLGGMFKEADDLGADQGSDPGWSQLLDLTRSQDKWLRWVAQLTGYYMPEQPEDYAVERTRIVTRSAHRRGSQAVLIEAVQEHLSGTKSVLVKWRDTSPHHFTVYVYDSEIVTSAAEVRATAQAQKAKGLIMDLIVIEFADWDVVTAEQSDWNEVAAKFVNWDDLQSDPGRA